MSGKNKMPDTSIQAYEEKTIQSINTDWEKIEKALRALGKGTYDDIASYLGLKDINVVSRRMKEMREKGKIVRTDEKKKTSRNR